MSDTTIDVPSTSTAATGETEPAIVAAIASGEGQPSPHRDAGRGFSYRGLALLGAGVALGCAVGLWRRFNYS